MSEELEINRMVAEFVNQNIDRFYNTGKGILKGAADTARLHLLNSYKEYLACITDRYSKAKTFLFRNEPVSIYTFYVPIGISGRRLRLSQPDRT